MSWFPRTSKNVKEILISNVMRPDNYSGNDAAGLWVPSDRRIIIHRNQLKKAESFTGTLIHEIVHANTGTNDQILAFENELTNALGKLAMLLVKENPQPTKKVRGIFSIFK